jgi:hypothetical protein
VSHQLQTACIFNHTSNRLSQQEPQPHTDEKLSLCPPGYVGPLQVIEGFSVVKAMEACGSQVGQEEVGYHAR